MARPLGLPRDGAIAAWFADNPEILRIEDVAANPHLQAMSRDESATLDELGASLIIPMVVKGSLTGLTIVGSKLVSSGYTAEDFRFLGTAADQMAIALENARLYAVAQRVAVERAALAELGLVVNSTLDLHRVF